MNPLPDRLAELRDIHLPAPPSWWPPAPGWWLLAVLLLVALAGLGWLWVRRRQRLAPVREALLELEQAYGEWQANRRATDYLYRVSTLLRRSLLVREPPARVAALSGRAWLQRLDAVAGGEEFTRGAGQVLGDGVYRRNPELDADALYALSRRTLRRLAGSGKNR